MTTNYIALDIIKNIIECEMSICDLSSKNPNVLYELGIRQAFNLPVTLIKDLKTNRIFDIQGFRDIEYDETLRIDTVETTIQDLAELLKNTYENRDQEINSLISLLSIEPAKISSKKKISVDTELILSSLTEINKRISFIENKSNSLSAQKKMFIFPENLSEPLTFDEFKSLPKGTELFHERHGSIILENVTYDEKNKRLAVIFKLKDNNILRRILLSGNIGASKFQKKL